MWSVATGKTWPKLSVICIVIYTAVILLFTKHKGDIMPAAIVTLNINKVY